MKQLLEERKNDKSSQSSWDTRKGPSPGIKWKGGTPPNPPKWNYSSSDLRAFSKFERRVNVWRLQVQNQLTGAEAGLMLFSSLTGEAEAESEHMELSRVNDKNGMDYMLSCLKGPLEQKVLYQKRASLANYEVVARTANETIRQYINRYKRIERDLQAVGIQTGAMYDSESRGNRILERCKLEPSLARLVLIGAHNSLDFDAIVESLQLQFPDFKTTRAVFHQHQPPWKQPQSFKSSGKSYSSTSASTTTSSSSTVPSSASAYNRSKGKGGYPPRKVFQAEHETVHEAENEDKLATADMAAEDEEFFETEENPNASPPVDPDPDQEDDDDLGASLSELASVLTVTSNKLKAATLGRKFTGRKSIQERKRTSSCSACGAIGHWAGDTECPVSAKGPGKGGKGKSKTATGGTQSSTSSSTFPKKTFVVTYGDEQQQDPQDPFYTFPANLMVDVPDAPFVYVTETIDLAGYMVLDTACQRSCAGSRWMGTHMKLLGNHGLQCHQVPCDDRFQFGAGACQQAATRCYFPAAFISQETQGIVLGASVLDVNIPFLASRILMEQLGCVIDMHQGILHFAVVGISVPLKRKHGHLVACITAFPPRVSHMSCWSDLQDDRFGHEPSPELVVHPEALAVSDGVSTTAFIYAGQSVDETATHMAGTLEDLSPPPVPVGVQSHQVHAQAGAPRNPSKDMAQQHGIARAAGEASCTDAEDHGVTEALHSPRVPAIRQPPRPLRQVQEMRSTGSSGTKSSELGRYTHQHLQARLHCPYPHRTQSSLRQNWFTGPRQPRASPKQPRARASQHHVGPPTPDQPPAQAP